mgnify:CR=1 FL=1
MVSIEGIASLEGVGGFALISRSGQHREMEERPHSFGKMCFTGSAIRNNCSKGWAGTGTATQGVGGVTIPAGVQESQRGGADQWARWGGMGILGVIPSLSDSKRCFPSSCREEHACVGQLQSLERAK